MTEFEESEGDWRTGSWEGSEIFDLISIIKEDNILAVIDSRRQRNQSTFLKIEVLMKAKGYNHNW